MNSHNLPMAPSPVQPLNRQGVRRISRSAQRQNSFVSAKSIIKIGNWNVRTLIRMVKLKSLWLLLKIVKLTYAH